MNPGDRFQTCCSFCGLIEAFPTLQMAIDCAEAHQDGCKGETIELFDCMAHVGSPQLFDAKGTTKSVRMAHHWTQVECEACMTGTMGGPIPGTLANGERCDTCERYGTDAAAKVAAIQEIQRRGREAWIVAKNAYQVLDAYCRESEAYGPTEGCDSGSDAMLAARQLEDFSHRWDEAEEVSEAQKEVSAQSS